MSQDLKSRQKSVKSRIPLDELAGLPNFYLPSLNYQRTKLAFYTDKTGRLELYIMDLATRQTKQITDGQLPRSLHAGYIWDHSGDYIFFTKDFDGNEQHDLWQIDLRNGEARQLTNNSTIQEFPASVSPDDQWLAILTNKIGQMNLWKMRRDGSNYEQITRYNNPVNGGKWSPDGQWIAYNVNAESSNYKNMDGYLVRPDGSDARQIFHIKDGSVDRIIDWHPVGQTVAVSSDSSGVNQPGVLNIETGEVIWLGRQGVEEIPSHFSATGNFLVCLRNQNSEISPVVYDLQRSTAKELKLPSGVAAEVDFIDDNSLILAFMSENRRNSLLLYNLQSDSYETLIEAEYGSIDQNILVSGEHIYYSSFDGRQIPALLYRPKQIEPGQKLPAIVNVHGGPTYQFTRGFKDDVQFLVDLGYVVLQPNVRGSTGYGVEFRDMALKDWGGGDLEDVAAGATYLTNLPYVDHDRISIFGVSYGGYMTYMAVTKKPDIWRSAIAIVGMTDLNRLYNESMAHFKYYLKEQMGDPEVNQDLWLDRSAINFAGNLKAKLLILHGANDPRCPIGQASFFRDKLIEAGFKEGEDFEYLVFADQGHGSNDINHKKRTYKLLADYFERAG